VSLLRTAPPDQEALMARAERPRRFTAQLVVPVTAEMHAALREQASARGCSVADLVREALDASGPPLTGEAAGR
jgi:predicted HicB family RNase H-like nuclease